MSQVIVDEAEPARTAFLELQTVVNNFMQSFAA